MSLILDESLKDYQNWEELQQQLNDSSYTQIPDAEVTFSFQDGVLRLDSKLFPKVYCDFLSERYLKEVKQSFGRSEGVFSFLRPIANHKKISICDLTVGMGKDLFKFVLSGHDVTGFERNPIFYHMVLNGIDRFSESSKKEELQKLFKVEAFKVNLKYGESQSITGEYDLCYFDPMFDDQSKKAAPKKGMQALKELAPSSKVDDKIETIRACLLKSKNVVYKCAGKTKEFPFLVKKEIKGKGFSYLIL